jgi:pyruvate,water dikinase
VIKQRKKGFAWYHYGKTNVIYTGKDIKKIKKRFKNQLEISLKDTKELTGQSAYLGKRVGTARIILSPQQIKKMKPNDILVTSMTTSVFMPALKQAAACVTDEGGILCHAAIVSRELKIPCLIGTKIATKVLKDGDRVEVDANKGIVKILKKSK